MAQDSALSYLRHGQSPFFRLPVSIGAPPPGTRAVFLGVPFDLGTTYQPGARLAPWHVRRVSALVQTYHPFHKVDVFARVPAVDGGNAAFPPFDPAAMRAVVEAEVARIAAAGASPFVLGGDHSLVLPVLRALAKAYGPLAVVHVDAHLDTSGTETWGEEFHHGTPFRHAVEEGLVAKGSFFQIGIRGPFGAASDTALVESQGGRIVSPEELDLRSASEVARELREAIGTRPMYLSFDIDALDPAFAPGTGTPLPGGLTTREAFSLLRGLGGVNLVGMDLVEVCPALDHADMTSALGAHLMFEGLALLAVRDHR